MEFVEAHWTRPDEGIWEIRSEPRHFTHSKLMAWVAADRAVKAVEDFGLTGPAKRWRSLRDDLRAEIMTNGYDGKRKTFTQYHGWAELDAALLMVPLVGFLPAPDPRRHRLRTARRRGRLSGLHLLAGRQRRPRRSP
jgi:GH15 family glucan-1,4-alpha-glucosidase